MGPWLVAALSALLLLPGLSGFGVWDPWELGVAQRARAIGTPGASPEVDAATFAASLGLRLLGVEGWSGRLPIAASAVLTVLGLTLVGGRMTDRRTGTYAGLVLISTPAFMLNSRTMFGAAPELLLHGSVALAAATAVLPEATDRRRWAGLGWLVVTGALSVVALGVLRGLLPALWAAVLTALFTRHRPGMGAAGARRPLAWATVATFALTLGTAAMVGLDRGGARLWTGGEPRGLLPGSFDGPIEAVFHGLAPWSALLPLAFAGALSGRLAQPRAAVALWAVLWAAGGYVAHLVYLARYGAAAAFLPLPGLALLVAVCLRDIEETNRPRWPAALASGLGGMLLLRDFVIFPEGVMASLPLAKVPLPDAVDERRAWAVLLGCFAVLALGFAASGADRTRPVARAGLDAVATQWRRSAGSKAWMLLAGAGVSSLVVLGVLAFAVPDRLHVTTLAAKWLRRATFAPALVALVAVGAPWGLYALSRLKGLRAAPLLLAGLAVGAFTSQHFLPALSAQLSPRSAYETYNRLAKQGEPLAEYKVGGRAAAYYAKGEVVDIKGLDALVKHLSGAGRSWATLPGDELARVNTAYRKRRGSHLFVVDAESQKVVLVSSEAIAGRDNANYLAEAVLTTPPTTIQHPTETRFGDAIELLGYDLKLPHAKHVGSGESFEIVWYYRVLRPVAGGYRPFVHIDGADRVHGDHQPVGGKYPVRLWNRGDIVADRHTVEVPASTRPGKYTIYTGFFSGERRLAVTQGASDKNKRAKVGVLRIR